MRGQDAGRRDALPSLSDAARFLRCRREATGDGALSELRRAASGRNRRVSQLSFGIRTAGTALDPRTDARQRGGAPDSGRRVHDLEDRRACGSGAGRDERTGNHGGRPPSSGQRSCRERERFNTRCRFAETDSAHPTPDCDGASPGARIHTKHHGRGSPHTSRPLAGRTGDRSRGRFAERASSLPRFRLDVLARHDLGPTSRQAREEW